MVTEPRNSEHEWQKCCDCMFRSVARGTTNLVEACGYLAVGTLYGGYAEAPWGPHEP